MHQDEGARLLTIPSLVPDKFKVVSGSALKLLAVITMLIDHVASVFLQSNTTVLLALGSHELTVYELMRLIGRIAFPIYAFLLVEGFHHTHNRRSYGLRLFVLALISEIPWNLVHSGTIRYAGQNVMFTLLLGYLGVCVLDRMLRGTGDATDLPKLFALLLAAILLRADYGCSGFGFILLMYLLREAPPLRAVLGSCILSSQWKAGLAFIPISLYNGKRGFATSKAASLAFYAIYPLHFLLLYVMRAHIIGY